MVTVSEKQHVAIFKQVLTFTVGEAADILASIDRSLLVGQSSINGELTKMEIYDILTQAVEGGERNDPIPSSLTRKIEKEFPIPISD
jgi:hypothetical protein